MVLATPSGMWIQGLRSQPPASSTSTEKRSRSLRRLATMEPALPAPTTMKSKAGACCMSVGPDLHGLADFLPARHFLLDELSHLRGRTRDRAHVHVLQPLPDI